MRCKTLLVCLEREAEAERLMDHAIALARPGGAHLIGIHVMEGLVAYPGISMHVPDPVFAQFNASQEAASEAMGRVFAAKTENVAFPCEWRAVRAGSSSAVDRMAESARGADLVIVGQEPLRDSILDEVGNQDVLIRKAGRPVLMIPREGDHAPVGKNMLLGWSDTREASRAALDLLSIAEPGAEVCILRAGSHKQDLHDHSALALAAMYDRHGLTASVVHRTLDGHSVSDVLEQEAVERGSDVIVTGAFGHSAIYDFVIGAATRDLMQNARRPVLFSK